MEVILAITILVAEYFGSGRTPTVHRKHSTCRSRTKLNLRATPKWFHHLKQNFELLRDVMKYSRETKGCSDFKF